MSVRSGAKFSMPGMMDTVLNLGLNEETLHGLVALTGNERFGWDAYRRFIQMFGRIVMDVKGERFDHALEAREGAPTASTQDTDLDAPRPAQALAGEFKAIVRERHRPRLPDRPVRAARPRHQGRLRELVRQAGAATTATTRRSPTTSGTAVNVVTMVFGNMGDDSGTGVAFTRDPNTGEKVLFGEYLTNAQGEDVVAGIRTAPKISQMQTDMPAVYEEFQRIGQQLEHHYRDVQDLEFTIERGRLYMLQTRSAKRTAAAAVKIAVDMVDEGIITQGGGARPGRAGPRRPAPARPVRPGGAQDGDADRQRPQRLARRRRRPGRVRRRHGGRVGRAAARRSSSSASRPRPTTSTAWPWPRASSPPAAARPRTPRSSPARSASPASPARPSSIVDYAGKQAHCNVTGIDVHGGRLVSLDGSTGELYLGALPTVDARFEDQPELQQILGWADEIRRMEVWTNADKPEEAAQARATAPRASACAAPSTCSARATGSRSCAARSSSRNQAHAGQGQAGGRRDADRRRGRGGRDVRRRRWPSSRSLQQGDFEGIFRAMDGLPVVIRLIDPPLHEFLPNLEEQLVKVTQAEATRRRAEEDESCSRRSSRCTSRTRCSACAAAAWA